MANSSPMPTQYLVVGTLVSVVADPLYAMARGQHHELHGESDKQHLVDGGPYSTTALRNASTARTPTCESGPHSTPKGRRHP